MTQILLTNPDHGITVLLYSGDDEALIAKEQASFATLRESGILKRNQELIVRHVETRFPGLSVGEMLRGRAGR